MYKYKACDNCNRMLENGNKVTVIIPEVEVTDRYSSSNSGCRLKLSSEAIESRAVKVYCKKCLDVTNHLEE